MALSSLGLINMGGQMLRPGGSLGDGFLGYGQGLAQDSRMKAQQAQTQAYLQQADMERQQFEAKQRQTQQQQENLKAFMASLQTPAQAAQAPAGTLNGPLGSGTFGLDPLAAMSQKAAPAGQKGGQWDAMKMLMGLRAGLKREDIEGLANASTLGMPEVARTIDQADSMGNPQTAQMDKFGRPVGAAINKPVELDLKDLGGEFQRYNKYTGGLVGNKIPQTVDPNSLLSANTTIRGQNMTDARAREFNKNQAAATAATRDAAKGKLNTETEMKLADDYRTESKDFRQVFPAVGKIKAALPMATKSAAATLAAATSFMKLLDPGSVVRESELGMALNATGAIDRMTNYVNTLQNGKVLTASQVADFDNVVDQVYASAVQSQELTDKAFTERAVQYGLRPEAIVSGITSKSAHQKANDGWSIKKID